VRLQYLLAQTGQSIRRNPLVVASAVVAVLVTLVLVFGAIVLRWSIDEDIGRWDDNVRVIAFLSDELTVEDVAALQAEVSTWDSVEDVVYFSKSEALEEFRGMFEDQPSLIEVVEEDPSTLPASIRIKPTEAADYSSIRNQLAVVPGIREVSAADEAIDALVTRSNRLRTFAVSVFFILGTAAVVLIANTIRMAVYARREEIGIMKLVGAGNWFVRVPFLLEGLLEGLVGALLAVIVVGLGHGFIVELLSTVADPENIQVPVDFLIRQSILVLGFGAVTGLVGSALGMWGFLKD
jgi:cell division transport system permease protein